MAEIATMVRVGLAITCVLVLTLSSLPTDVALARAPVARAADLPSAIRDVYVNIPRDLQQDRPAQVLVVLHGIGGQGEQLAAQVASEAERNHWVLVAPTISYGDWTDPAQVAREDPRLIRWLAEYLDRLNENIGLPVKRRILLLGHSRGAQLAHRFAFFEPQRVLAVAALAAGTYTLPVGRTSAGAPMRFPFGVGDMGTVAGHDFSQMRLIEDTEFWVGVGTEDTNAGELPRAWDAYLGTTRVQRARAFHKALRELGVKSVLVAFHGERHGLSPAMASSACSFLRLRALDQPSSAPATRRGSPTILRASHIRAHF